MTNQQQIPETERFAQSVSTTVQNCRSPSQGQVALQTERKIMHFDTSSVSQSCLTLCEPMDCSMPGLPVHHQLPELTQTHVHWVGDAIQPSHPLSFPSPPTFNISQHQGLFQWVSSSHQVARVLEFHLQHQAFHWLFRTDCAARLDGKEKCPPLRVRRHRAPPLPVQSCGLLARGPWRELWGTMKLERGKITSLLSLTSLRPTNL